MNNRADTIFVNGKVITVDAKNRVCEAVAVAGNRICYVGSSGEAEALADSKTEVVDLAGRSLLPGFVDSHCHAGTHGFSQLQVPCSPKDVCSIRDIQDRIKRSAASIPPEQWILGRGYNHFALEEKRHPTRWDLDTVAPDHKVFLVRTCGHIAVANSRVLKEFGIERNTPDPSGGRIERDGNGEPTGVLYEQAALDIRMKTQPSVEDMEKGLRIMNRDFLSLGITSAHDASGLYPDEISAFQRGVSQGWIDVRLYLMFRVTGEANQLGERLLQTGLLTGFGNDRLRIGPYKIMLDGAGSGGSAAMRQAYPHDPEEFGITYLTQEDLDAKILKAHRAGYQVAIHAIGDRAVEMALTGYERALCQVPRKNHRHRIEHCGFLDDAMLNKVRDLGIVPALGLPFLYEIGDAYHSIYGHDRLGCIYPLRSLLDRGIPAALSSDAPVIHPNPMHGIYFALTHKTKTGKVIAPHESVDLMRVIRAYTWNGAYASFEENIKGSLETGKLADLVVLSRDILNAAPEEIIDIKADLTMVNGKILHQTT